MKNDNSGLGAAVGCLIILGIMAFWGLVILALIKYVFS